MQRKSWQLWLGIAVSALSFAALFLFIDASAVWASLQTVEVGTLLLGGVFIIIYMVMRAVRWRYLLADQPPLGRVFHVQNIGYMLTQLLPFRLGDVARAVLIGNEPPVTIAQGLSTMVVERVLDMLLIILLLPLAAARVPSLPDWLRDGARVSTGLALTATVVLVLAANFRPIARRLATRLLPGRPALVDALDNLLAGLVTLTRWRSGVMLALLSIVTWLPIIVAYHIILDATHNDPTPVLSIVTVCAAALSIAAPSSPSQAGVFHAAVTLVLTTVFGRDPGPAGSFAFVYHAFNFLMLIVLGVVGLLRSGTTFGRVVSMTRAFNRRDPA